MLINWMASYDIINKRVIINGASVKGSCPHLVGAGHYSRPRLQKSRPTLHRTAASFRGFGVKTKPAPQKKKGEALPVWEVDSSKCPCGSGKAYTDCCQPYHEGQPVPTPEAVMRARFSAYVKKNADFLVTTVHPDSPLRDGSKTPDGKQSSTLKEDIIATFRTIAWKRLKILGTSNYLDAEEATVQFTADFKVVNQKGQKQKGNVLQCLRETTTFRRDAADNNWKTMHADNEITVEPE